MATPLKPARFPFPGERGFDIFRILSNRAAAVNGGAPGDAASPGFASAAKWPLSRPRRL